MILVVVAGCGCDGDDALLMMMMVRMVTSDDDDGGVIVDVGLSWVASKNMVETPSNRISSDSDRTWVMKYFDGYGPTMLLLCYCDRKESLFINL
ncbi:hypothetical protein Tco_0205228 [Tanacetum coccineum]